jgi:hypothetical protein
MKNEQPTSHLTKTQGSKRDAKRHSSDKVTEDFKPSHQPYKKPKTNFKHFVEHLLDDEELDDLGY